MPALQPIELWKESGRYETFGDLLMKLTIGGNHARWRSGRRTRRSITDLVRDLVRSYKQLPITLYQIQTKFRDEPRPRFGILRTREFLMKDAYSFDADVDQLNTSYDAMYEAYCRIFDRCGIPYVDRRGRERPDRRRQLARVHGPLVDRRGLGHPVHRSAATPPTTSGPRSAPGPPPPRPTRRPRRSRRSRRPNRRTIQEVCDFLKVPESTTRQAARLPRRRQARRRPDPRRSRGQRGQGPPRLRRHDPRRRPTPPTIEKATGAPMGFLGPVAIKIPLVVDRAVAAMPTVVVGGNEVDVHLTGVVPGRDFPLDRVLDLRNAVAGDPCPRCGAADGRQPGDRDRPRLQARHQVFEGDGGDLPRREGERDPADHGLLRDRREPDRRRGRRGRPRRQRHRLAAAARALPGRWSSRSRSRTRP